MKVNNVNLTTFKNTQNVTTPNNVDTQKPQIKELSNVTPDYAVKIPQKYQKIGVEEFANGLKLHTYKLANGHKISIIPMENAPATVKNYVNVGAFNETDDIKGISHFLEHMAFNGTTGENGYIKLETGDSFAKIDKLGGWTNASTSFAVTDYINSTPLLEEKDLEEQLKIIAGMTEDLALSPEMIEKEKGPVCSEINMILDDPQTIAFDQTVRTALGIKSSADELIAGSTKHINNLTREKVKEYYDKYYTPDNMNLVITGDINPDEVIELVAKNFRSTKKSKGQKFEEKFTPIEKTIRKDFISDKATSAEIVLGFVGSKNNDTRAKVIEDVLANYILSSTTGIRKELRKINTTSNFAFEKLSTNPNNPTLIYYAMSCADENSEKALKIIFDKFSNLKAPSDADLENIKKRLLSIYKESCEHSLMINGFVGNSTLNNNLDYVLEYEAILNSITKEEIQDYIDKYLDLNKAAITVVHPETTIENINKNHTEASKLSFKGKRIPLNTSKVEEKTLDNNIKAVFLDTNNDNITFNINFKHPPITNTNPAVIDILDTILCMGTIEQNEDEFEKYLEDNNIDVAANLSKTGYYINGYSDFDNFEKTFNKAKELIYSPRITEDTIKIAVSRLKDSIERTEDSAYGLYCEEEAKINPLYSNKDVVLKNLDSVTVEDVKKYHQYLLENSCANIVINNPKGKNIKDKATELFENLDPVQEHSIITPKVYKPNLDSKVITKDKNVAQADIMQTFKFEHGRTPKEYAMLNIINTILTSSSIGVFTVLREKEHLAYRVGTDFKRTGNCGKFTCHILTTTDNKENGEISYDNVQKSINGFNRQINAFLSSEYTDEDLLSAKRKLKADILNNETTSGKVSSLSSSLSTNEGLHFDNKVYELIDSITKEDLEEYSRKIFANPPIYTIVASKDTLEANKDYFETL